MLKNLEVKNFNGVKNQFILSYEGFEAFQSYKTLIAQIDYNNNIIIISKDYKYSQTTSKYRNVFFEGMFDDINTTKKLEEAIYQGFAFDNFNNKYKVVMEG